MIQTEHFNRTTNISKLFINISYFNDCNNCFIIILDFIENNRKIFENLSNFSIISKFQFSLMKYPL